MSTPQPSAEGDVSAASSQSSTGATPAVPAKDGTIYQRGYQAGSRRAGDAMVRAVRLEQALQQIADMDPAGERADDLGKAARVARAAIAKAGGDRG